ncbi:MAG: hypothetical protein ACE5K4_07540 [Candidatus Hydrothermarchaeota archaeon]
MAKKIDPIELFKQVSLSWAYGVGMATIDNPKMIKEIFSNAGNYWRAYQKKKSNIEIKKDRPFEVAKNYIEDCKKEGYMSEEDNITGDDKEMKVEHYSCFYRPLCLDLESKKLPVMCVRLAVLRNVIHTGSGVDYKSAVIVGKDFCTGILTTEPPKELSEEEVESLLEVTMGIKKE